jgi:hypothetical protein
MQNTTERKDVCSRINAQIVERLDEIIDAREIANRWQVPQTWIRNWTREGYANDLNGVLDYSRNGGKSADAERLIFCLPHP